MSDYRSPLQAVATELRSARRVLVITGAGMSADSGLPTYRGIGGLYDSELTEDGLAIEDALSGRMMQARPALTWKYIQQIEAACRGAGPNPGHAALVAFEQQLAEFCLLTQNIDGLHRSAGSRKLVEIHGNVHDLHCSRCSAARRVHSYEGLPALPRCDNCGAVERPAVVLFGEMLPAPALDHLQRFLAGGVDLVISIGTTSVFPYIAGPVVMAARQQIATVEINPGNSEVSEVVRYRLQVGAAQALQDLQALLGW